MRRVRRPIQVNGRSLWTLFDTGLANTYIMQNWGIRPCPDTESLDLTHYPEEWVEFPNA